MIIDKLEKYFFTIASYYQHSIGVSLSHDNVHVLELNRDFKKFNIINQKQYKISGNDFQIIAKDINNDFALKDKLISINVYNPVCTFKLLSIPKMEESDIYEWLKENYSEFLPSTVSLEKITFTYKIVKSNEEIILLLGIVNINEVEELISGFGFENNLIVSLTPGNVDLILFKYQNSEEYCCTYILNKDYNEIIVNKGSSLLFYDQIPKTFHHTTKSKNTKESYLNTIMGLYKDSFNLLDFHPSSESFYLIDYEEKNLELDIEDNVRFEYLLSYAQARTGYHKSDSSLNFIPDKIKNNVDTFIWKQAFQKTTVVAGTGLFVMYFIVFIATFILGSFHEDVLSEREALRPQLSQVIRLDNEKNRILNNLHDAQKINEFKSNSTVLLQAVAFHIPKGSWLTEINFDQDSEKGFNTILKGMGKDKTIINNFLGNLERDNNFKKVKLNYINKISSDDMHKNWKIRSSKYLEFQISLEF